MTYPYEEYLEILESLGITTLVKIQPTVIHVWLYRKGDCLLVLVFDINTKEFHHYIPIANR